MSRTGQHTVGEVPPPRTVWLGLLGQSIARHRAPDRLRLRQLPQRRGRSMNVLQMCDNSGSHTAARRCYQHPGPGTERLVSMQAKPTRPRKRGLVQKVCPTCGSDFVARKTGKFCSRRCSGLAQPRKPDALHPEQTGYRRAHTLYPAPLGPCERCGEREAVHRHHRDRDVFNNARSNMEFVCVSCHMREHKAMRQPEPCINCQRPCGPKQRRRGRCLNCRSYFERTGKERPLRLETRVKGVRFHEPSGRWVAMITPNRKNRHLGYFDTFEEALAARRAAEAELAA